MIERYRHPCRHDHEFVSAEPGDQALVDEDVAYLLGEHLDELVTSNVTQGVVDGFETVKIEKQRRDWAELPRVNLRSRCCGNAQRLCSLVKSSWPESISAATRACTWAKVALKRD